MQKPQTNKLKIILRGGLLAGVALLYVSVVGMLVAFSEREVIRDTLSLGQLLLFTFSAAAGYYVTNKIRGTTALHLTAGAGILTGVVAGIPLITLVILSNYINFRDIFTNITNNLIATLTFEQESQVNGILMLIAFLAVSSVAGSILVILPAKIRRILLTATAWTLGIGILSELVRRILSNTIENDVLNIVFRRNTLLPGPALAIFVIILVTSLFWSYQGQRLRSRINALPQRQQRNLRTGGFTILGIVLLLLPWLIGTAASNVMANVGLYVLMGLGLNIAVGLAGLLDLGYVTNFAVGAYVMGALTSTGPLGFETRTGLEIFNFWLVLPISMLIAMFTGFITAVPVLRMRGDYLAITTLGFGEIIRVLVLSDWLKPLVGGAQGILFIPKPPFLGYDFTVIELNQVEHIYYIILAACLLAIFVSTRLNNSRIGRQWMAIREDEDVAAAMGINTARSKILAFTLSAAAGGVAGAIFATKVGTIYPTSFPLLVSINVLSLIIVGGLGSVPGVVVGAFALVGLPELLREFDEFRLLIYGALLIAMMLMRPQGLWPSVSHRREVSTPDEHTPTQPSDAAATADNPSLAAGD